MLFALSYVIFFVVSEYVADHWMDDDFYGYQFLNGVNPIVVTKCTELPANFPVTEEMVKPFLDGSSLQDEIQVCKMGSFGEKCISSVTPFLFSQKGNIFLFDAKIMDGAPVRDYDGKPLHVTPGLCLLYVNSDKKLLPIAIQVFSS